MAGALRVGLRIDRYELTRQIAEGGFGVIFQAKDVNLGRELAIKFLLPQHNSNPEIVSRFVGEARTLARVVHPGIVTVYESGEVQGTNTKADGIAFILMELVDGETLSQRIKRTGPMPPANAMEICRQIANALNAAHQLGMIHRDLKPDNIMLTKDPAIAIGERAKVLDFGIAKNAANSAVSAATQIGMVFGTPAYMSPEQCRSSTDVTPASDVYALGCILFELLLGRPPFLGAGMGELFAAHLMSPPPVPSSLNPSLPRHLDEVIAAMLAKEPAGRPASMMVVERILEDSRLGGAANKPIRTRTLGGAILVGDLPFPPKAGFAVDMGPSRPVAPNMAPNMPPSMPPNMPQAPITTERGHHPSGPQTPISQPVVDAPRMTPNLDNAADATLLGATRPVMPTAAEAAAMMRNRSPSTAPPHMATVAMQSSPALPLPAAGPAAAQKTVFAQMPVMPPAPMEPARTMIATPGTGPREEPRAHPNPTTMMSATGQSTPRPQAPKSSSKLWLVGGVICAAAIAAVIVVVTTNGGGEKSASEPAGSAETGVTPVGSNHTGSATTNTGSATTSAGGSAGSATTHAGSNAGSDTGSAMAHSGSDAGSDTGSATTHAGSDTGSATTHAGSDTGSATTHAGSDAGSATTHAGSDAGSATTHAGSDAGSATTHAGSNAGSAQTHAGSNAGSAQTHAGSNAGSAQTHAGSATTHAGSNAGSAQTHAGSNAGSGKKDPHAGSGSACQGRSCILDGQF